MAKNIDKIVYSTNPPQDSNVLWYDGKTLRGLKNGNWKPVGIDTEMQENISKLLEDYHTLPQNLDSIKELAEHISSYSPDFSAKQGSTGYIKNRTHYIEDGVYFPLDEKFIPQSIARLTDIPEIPEIPEIDEGYIIDVTNLPENGIVEGLSEGFLDALSKRKKIYIKFARTYRGVTTYNIVIPEITWYPSESSDFPDTYYQLHIPNYFNKTIDIYQLCVSSSGQLGWEEDQIKKISSVTFSDSVTSSEVTSMINNKFKLITINEDKSLSNDDIKLIVMSKGTTNLTFKLDSNTFLTPSFCTKINGSGPSMGIDVVKCSFFYDGVEHIYSWNFNSFSYSGGTLKEYKEVAYQPIESA